jgi:hypothetical protein
LGGSIGGDRDRIWFDRGLAIIAAVNGLGSTLNTNFSTINSSLK